MTETRLPLPCGCAVMVSHTSADRLLRCPGGGLSPRNGSVARESLVECKGGQQYKVTAEPVASVRYCVTRFKASR